MASELKYLCLAISLLMPAAASAAGCPAPACFTRPVELSVSAPPGGPVDTAARTIAAPLAVQIGQSVIVNNKAGASGAIGGKAVVDAAPDSHTILVTNSGAMVVAPSLYRAFPFDPLKDLVPVIQIGSMPYVLVVRSDSPWKSLDDFVAAARTGGKPVTYGSAGSGSPSHLLAEQLRSSGAGQLQHVPYKGAAPGFNDLLGEKLDAMFVDTSWAKGQIQNNRLRALAITGDRRSPALPNVPTFNERGIAGMESTWIGVFYPAKTHPNIVLRLSSETQKLLADPNVRKKLEDVGIVAGGLEGEAFARAMVSQSAMWQGLIRNIGLKPQ